MQAVDHPVPHQVCHYFLTARLHPHLQVFAAVDDNVEFADIGRHVTGCQWQIMACDDTWQLASGTVTRGIPPKYVKCCHVGMHDAEQMQGLQHVIPKYYRGDHGGPQ